MENSTFCIDYRGTGVNVAQMQVMATCISQMLKEQFSEKNAHFLEYLPLPNGFSSWEELNAYCESKLGCHHCELLVDKYEPIIIPCHHTDHTFPDMLIYFVLISMQSDFGKLSDLSVPQKDFGYVTLTNNFCDGFILANNNISQYYFNRAYEAGTFDWNDKYHPLLTDLRWLRNLRGDAQKFERHKQDSHARRIFNAELRDFATQSRYLSFWCCLLQIVTFQGLPITSQTYLELFAERLLSIRSNVYVHHITVESSAYNTDTEVEERGEKDNTTRLKIYFTFEDGRPLVARFDMPHKGQHNLHLNVEDENGQPLAGIDHCKIASLSTAEDIIKPLEESLLTFGYEAVKFEHTPAEIDRAMLDRVKVERALFNLCPAEWGTLLLADGRKNYSWEDDLTTELPESCRKGIKADRAIINEYAASFGVSPADYSKADIFDFVYDKLFT